MKKRIFNNQKIRVGLFIATIILLALSQSFKIMTPVVSHKCLIQLTNYTGEGAYLVVSLVDQNGKYIKTLQVFGKEKRWWEDITSWFKHLTTSKEKVDGITGASITAGDRKVFTVTSEADYFNKNFKLRFESAVEDQKYVEKDVEIDYNDENVGKNIQGNGYVRYIKLIKIQS